MPKEKNYVTVFEANLTENLLKLCNELKHGNNFCSSKLIKIDIFLPLQISEKQRNLTKCNGKRNKAIKPTTL